MLRPDAVLIGTWEPSNPSLAERLAERGSPPSAWTPFPITRAQSMDSPVVPEHGRGYKAVLLAASRLPKFFPLLTTAAGTVRPARGLIMGAGVAGLMAIGTARRLGAVVEAFDVRPVVKEQVESLGPPSSRLPMTDEEKASAQTAGGYAREMSEDYQRRQRSSIAERVQAADFVITTALIPGRPAPKLITADMVRTMQAERDRRHGRRGRRQHRADRAWQGGRGRRCDDHRPSNLPATVPTPPPRCTPRTSRPWSTISSTRAS